MSATPLPAVTRHVAGPKPSGNGFQSVNSTGPVAISNQSYSGYDNGIVVQNHNGGVTMNNVMAMRSWRATEATLFGGQGMYLSDITGPINIYELYLNWNGWQQGQNWWDKNTYRHGIYLDEGCTPLNLNTAIIANHPGCGIQCRSGATLNNVVLYRNSMNFANVLGPVTISNSIIFGSDYFYAGGIPLGAWVGLDAIKAYWPVTLVNCMIVGEANMLTPRNPNGVAGVPALKAYSQGCLNVGGTWPAPAGHTWSPPPSGPLVTLHNCTVSGWGGALATGETNLIQWNDTKHLNIDVAYDPTPVFTQIEANTLSIVNAVAQIKTAVMAQFPAGK